MTVTAKRLADFFALPLTLVKDDRIIDANGNEAIPAPGAAEIIVRAVNCHDDLLDALKAVQPYFEGEHHPDHPHCVQLRNALAKAEGRTSGAR